MNSEFDFIIVGGGTAGCVLANRLSKNSKNNVLLVEAGKKDNYFWINIPVGYLFTVGNPKTDWCYKTTEDPGLNGRSIGYARGKVLGGSSSINAMIYMRGQATDYNYWESTGCKGWSWDNVLPIFKRSEDYQHGANEFHGVGGELRVEERRVNWEVLDVWREAAEESGIKKVDEFNRGDNSGCAYFQMNQKKGLRWNATKAYLKPIRDRNNLTILTNTMVTRIILNNVEDDLVAQGIEVDLDHKKSQPRKLFANKEVIISAGAIGSPQLLQLSGIGEDVHLASLGINLKKELKGVGRNLQDHLQLRSVYKVRNTVTLNEKINSSIGKISMALEYLFFRTGPFTMPPSQLGAFAKSHSNLKAPNLEWHVQPLSLEKFGSPLHTFNAITPSVCNLQPTSRGSVKITSSSAYDYPKIQLNYLSTPEDENIAVESLKFTRRIMKASAFDHFFPEELLPGKDIVSNEGLLNSARNIGTTIFHPVGTCKMGIDEFSVVNEKLKVHGVNKLRIVDASIMPKITSGNTNAPTVMIAEKGSEMILRENQL